MYSMGCWFHLDRFNNIYMGAKGLVRMSEPMVSQNGGCLGLGGITGLISGEVITMMML